MNRSVILCALVSLLSVVGCTATALHVQAMDMTELGVEPNVLRGTRETVVGTTGGGIQTDAYIQTALARRAQMPTRAKVAVAQLYWENPGLGSVPTLYSRLDKESKETIRKQLTDRKLFSSVSFISEVQLSYGGGAVTLDALRVAAADANADVVLLLINRQDTDRYNNPLGLTYLAVAPMLFVPASHYNVMSVETALLLDVRNGHLYLSAEGEHTEAWVGPDYWLDREEVEKAARKAATDQLFEEMTHQLDALAETIEKKASEA